MEFAEYVKMYRAFRDHPDNKQLLYDNNIAPIDGVTLFNGWFLAQKLAVLQGLIQRVGSLVGDSGFSPSTATVVPSRLISGEIGLTYQQQMSIRDLQQQGFLQKDEVPHVTCLTIEKAGELITEGYCRKRAGKVL